MSAFDPKIVYRISQATNAEVLEHLRSCSDQFVPPLEERVDLEAYAEKLVRRSRTFEAWQAERLVGLVAAYFESQSVASPVFVSSVSVLQAFRSRGIARKLMENCHRRAIEQGRGMIRLEVSAGNGPAIRLYSSLGYTDCEQEGDNRVMEIKLRSEN